jgi:hypothetical protein
MAEYIAGHRLGIEKARELDHGVVLRSQVFVTKVVPWRGTRIKRLVPHVITANYSTRVHVNLLAVNRRFIGSLVLLRSNVTHR